jgi:peptidoglycan/xylan/chitin deacetylase (PgdA/CDA1 family)
MKPIRTYAEFSSCSGSSGRLRAVAREAAVLALSIGRNIKRTSGWIRFPYYHHVFDDERHGFNRQLNYLRGYGEFISLDDVVGLLNSGGTIDGRYFCITFDDGFKNCLTNAVPILLDKGAPAVFFMTTEYIDSDPERDMEKLLGFFDSGTILMEFLSWQNCRDMASEGMTIGSHTVNHARLVKLSEEKVLYELTTSKAMIEDNLSQVCNHFCSPFGIPDHDYNVERDPRLVRASGYKSMLTTKRGATRRGASPYQLCRDHILANWGNHQLRYFLSL